VTNLNPWFLFPELLTKPTWDAGPLFVHTEQFTMKLAEQGAGTPREEAQGSLRGMQIQ
jgi:hypothetical protein